MEQAADRGRNGCTAVRGEGVIGLRHRGIRAASGSRLDRIAGSTRQVGELVRLAWPLARFQQRGLVGARSGGPLPRLCAAS